MNRILVSKLKKKTTLNTYSKQLQPASTLSVGKVQKPLNLQSNIQLLQGLSENWDKNNICTSNIISKMHHEECFIHTSIIKVIRVLATYKQFT